MCEPSEQSNFDDIGEFHTKFGLTNVTKEGAGPREVDPELLLFRAKFLLEELQEFLEATGMFITRVDATQPRKISILQLQRADIDHALAFDALLDLVVVAMGTAHLMGYPWPEGWRLVQEANMAKVRAAKDGSDSKRGSAYDIVKPPGWTAPDIEGLLRKNGWTA